jgi:DNA mismatch endonuclease (patch repair protein)
VSDHLTPAGRSRVMAAIRSKDTKPELAVRSALRRRGASGYRLHVATLPGRPDIAFTRWRVAVFLDGAFWHGHPAHFNSETASEYWRAKIARTQERDRLANQQLQAAGWIVLRFWDFEVKKCLDDLVSEIEAALRAAGWSETLDFSGQVRHPPTERLEPFASDAFHHGDG